MLSYSSDESQAELDQLAEGLRLFGVLSLIQHHSQQFKPLFVSDVLTVSCMTTLFETTFSRHGSTLREVEVGITCCEMICQ
jgi:hypothetical protein